MAITAISTPTGVGGIAVVRLSGTDALDIAAKVWHGCNLADAASHTAHLGTFCTPDGRPIDQAVATIFRGPNSYTGFDTIEFSLHGSTWIQHAAIAALVEAGADPAERGEFTRQAFLNGRIDLAQAEGIADLMGASSRASAQVALTQVAGGVSSKLKNLRDELLRLTALLELELDFSEEDVEFADRTQLADGIRKIKAEVTKLADSYRRGKIYKEGLSVALAGIPNAGKSSLLNCLVDEDKAIVTDIAGTTRDIIEATAEIEGILCRFFDTAGLRATTDVVEELGIKKARERIEQSAVILWLIDPTQPETPQYDELIQTLPMLEGKRIILVRTKSDLPAGVSANADSLSVPRLVSEFPAVTVSATDLNGIEDLKLLITGNTEKQEDVTYQTSPQETLITNLRHYNELKQALPYLERLEEGLTQLPTDLLAEELRGALHHIGMITGEITTPQVLQKIFTSFCIGK